MSDDLVLIRGRDISELPWTRLNRARVLAEAVLLKLGALEATGGMGFRIVVDPSRTSGEIRLTLGQDFDVEDLSLELSEVVHHVRSAMDSMAWQLAHAAGGQPKNPVKVTFPAAKNDEAWANARANLAGMRPELVERIGKHQPFTRGPVKANGWPTAVVAALSNTDKHRGLLAIQPAVFGVSGTYATSTQADAILVEAKYDIRRDFPLVDDAAMGSLTWEGELTEVDLSSIAIEMRIGMTVTPRTGESYVVPIHELPMAIDYLGYEFEYLLSGKWPTNAPPVAPPA